MAKSPDCEPYEMNELSKVLEQIENALSRVLNRIQKLNEESFQAKTEITESFGRQFSNLHNRETQLLRQVDVIFRARGELLQKQLAHCYKLLGALETSRKWSEQLQKYSCDISFDNAQLEEIEKWATNIPLSWSLNENDLQEAIASFGKVDMDGVLLLPSSEQSKCLPGRVEEYFEEDHQVMNKPLHSNVIDIKFPKLPKDYSYWLARPKTEEKKDCSYGPYRKAADSYKPCDVQTWLGCIQTATAAEPMEEVGDASPDFVALTETASESSKESDSIEIVFSPDICNQFKLKGNDNSRFTDPSMEIENLAESFSACMKSEKHRWLLPSHTTEEDFTISKVCKANSLCKSFNSCLCDLNCYDTARKNREDKENQKRKASGYQEWLWSDSYLSKASTGTMPQLSLSFSENDYTKWLHPSSFASNKTSPSKILECPVTCEDPNYTKWLHPESLAERGLEKESNSAFHKLRNICFSSSEAGSQDNSNVALPQNNIWLANSSVNQSLTNNPALLICETLNELKQNRGTKLSFAQDPWVKWLKR